MLAFKMIVYRLKLWLVYTAKRICTHKKLPSKFDRCLELRDEKLSPLEILMKEIRFVAINVYARDIEYLSELGPKGNKTQFKLVAIDIGMDDHEKGHEFVKPFRKYPLLWLVQDFVNYLTRHFKGFPALKNAVIKIIPTYTGDDTESKFVIEVSF